MNKYKQSVIYLLNIPLAEYVFKRFNVDINETIHHSPIYFYIVDYLVTTKLPNIELSIEMFKFLLKTADKKVVNYRLETIYEYICRVVLDEKIRNEFIRILNEN